MKATLRTCALGVFAGALIALGGAMNLQCSAMGHPILGGVFFSFGLMCVCVLGANLFTGKVGYVFEKDAHYALDVVIMMIGNVIGALIVGYIFGLISPSWSVSLEAKLLYGEGSSWYGCLLRSILAGVFVYLAVECFRKIDHYPAKLIMVCLSIASMVILGCNHSIANVFYFAYAHLTNASYAVLPAVLSVVVAMLGNAVGSVIIYFLQNGLVSLFKPKQEQK